MSAHEWDHEHPPANFTTNRHLNAKMYFRWACGEQNLRYEQKCLRGLAKWKHYLQEIIGVPWNIRRLKDFWNAYEADAVLVLLVMRNCERLIEKLREQVESAQMRHQWAMARCDLLVGGISGCLREDQYSRRLLFDDHSILSWGRVATIYVGRMFICCFFNTAGLFSRDYGV